MERPNEQLVQDDLPQIGEEVNGDYITYPNTITQEWLMLGTFEYPMGVMHKSILIGTIPENFGGISALASRLRESNRKFDTPKDYVSIKREIRQSGGSYRDFSSVEEFNTFQQEQGERRKKELQRLEDIIKKIKGRVEGQK